MPDVPAPPTEWLEWIKVIGWPGLIIGFFLLGIWRVCKFLGPHFVEWGKKLSEGIKAYGEAAQSNAESLKTTAEKSIEIQQESLQLQRQSNRVQEVMSATMQRLIELDAKIFHKDKD